MSVRRCLPLLFSARPKTPLRVLCIMAFDTLHMLRSLETTAGRDAPDAGSVARFWRLHECDVRQQGILPRRNSTDSPDS